MLYELPEAVGPRNKAAKLFTILAPGRPQQKASRKDTYHG
jgi:hypothetical protein